MLSAEIKLLSILNKYVDFAVTIGSKFEPISPRHHQKNVLESKHGILRSIFIRLSNDDNLLDEEVRITLTIDISNIIASPTIYKIMTNGDRTLKLRTRISPHGTEGSSRLTLRSDCSVCPPAGFRIIASLFSVRR